MTSRDTVSNLIFFKRVGDRAQCKGPGFSNTKYKNKRSVLAILPALGGSRGCVGMCEAFQPGSLLSALSLAGQGSSN